MMVFGHMHDILGGKETNAMLRIGIIGCGNIAGTLAATMLQMPDRVKIEAVASRSVEKAGDFAARFGVDKAYGSYEELYDDEDVDLVYVATPHAFHCAQMLDALERGKHILCEKAFCINAQEAEKVFALAARKHLYVAEAIWTRYMPSRKIINDIISSGRIGRVTTISANLGYRISQKDRIADPALGGGALLDIGIYPLNFALMAAEGDTIKSMSGLAVKTERNIDIRSTIQMEFESGTMATIYSDAECVSDRRGIICGTDGSIEVSNVNDPDEIQIYSTDRPRVLLETIPIKHAINGYEYEIDAAAKGVAEGRTESEAMPWRETLRVLRIMDAMRSVWGIKLGSELE